MPVYKSCGVLGFFKPEATERDFQESGYEPGQFVTSCGFLGFSPKPATLYAIPESWREACTPLSGAKNGSYEVTAPGACTLEGCAGGAIKANGRCVQPGTSCVPPAPQPHASYTYAATGECALSACGVGTSKRPDTAVSSAGTNKCPVGYTSMADAAACKAAASRYGIAYGGTIHEPGIMGGCVVYNEGAGAAKAAFNETDGVDSGGGQFRICGRDDKDPCVTIGTVCGASSNYKWNSKGFCQGSCGKMGEVCTTGERCCTDTCTPTGVKCAMEQNLAAEATDLGAQIHALTGSFQQIGASVNDLHGLK